MIAVIGASTKSGRVGILVPNTSNAEDDAAIPAIKRSESPGKKSPINNPVSAKIMLRIPTNPKVVTMAWASKRSAKFIGAL